MTLPRSLKWMAGISLALVVLVVLAVAFPNWNWLREPIARTVGGSIGRTFAINGDLKVYPSLRPRIVADDVVLGNATWSREPDMVRIERLDFTIDLLKLLAGSVVFPAMALSEPRIALEVRRDGTPNWVFDVQDRNKPFDLPPIGALTVDRGRATYRDPTADTDLTLDVATLDADAANPETRMDVAANGRFQGLPATLHARGGALLSLRSVDHPYPLKASGTLGATKADIEGVLLDPLHLRGVQLNFRIEGHDLALLFPIIGVPFPPTPSYKLAGFLDHAGDVWTFRGFKGTVGHSDIAGDFAVDRGRRPQMITAGLVSQKLDMNDFAGFIGAGGDPKPARAPSPDDRVLPAAPFNLEKLQAADADVSFRGEKILIDKMPIEKMTAHLVVSGGRFRLAPLDFWIAGGNLVSRIEMDGRKLPIAARADITAKGLHLDRMFPASRQAGANTGTMGGRAKLDASGNSIAQMLASANGEAALIMDGGSVSELMLRLSNLDVANSIGVLLGGDRQIPIRCMVGNFKAVDGDFRVETLVLDTPKVNIVGSGHANFADESLHLRLVAQGKGFSLASLRGPIAVTGSFKTPVVQLETGGALARGGLALALGAVTAGIGALIPLLDFGEDRNSNCAALMSRAKADAGVKASDLMPRVGK